MNTYTISKNALDWTLERDGKAVSFHLTYHAAMLARDGQLCRDASAVGESLSNDPTWPRS